MHLNHTQRWHNSQNCFSASEKVPPQDGMGSMSKKQNDNDQKIKQSIPRAVKLSWLKNAYSRPLCDIFFGVQSGSLVRL